MLFSLLQCTLQMHLLVIDVPLISVKLLQFHYSSHFS